MWNLFSNGFPAMVDFFDGSLLLLQLPSFWGPGAWLECLVVGGCQCRRRTTHRHRGPLVSPHGKPFGLFEHCWCAPGQTLQGATNAAAENGRGSPAVENRNTQSYTKMKNTNPAFDHYKPTWKMKDPAADHCKPKSKMKHPAADRYKNPNRQ